MDLALLKGKMKSPAGSEGEKAAGGSAPIACPMTIPGIEAM